MPTFSCPSATPSLTTPDCPSKGAENSHADSTTSSRIPDTLAMQTLVDFEEMQDEPIYSAKASLVGRSCSGVSDILERFQRLGARYMVFDDDEEEQFYDAAVESEDPRKDEYFDSDEESEEEEEWKLQLPIHGTIALRRSQQRGKDPATVEREQHSQLHHEIADKFGPLQNVEVVFKEVDYETPCQPRTRMARLMEGEPISPTTIPTLRQMNIKEYNEFYGIKFDWETWLKHYDETVEEEFELYSISEDEFLECNYFARRQSMPSAEEFFVENPFKGVPSSAPIQME